MNELVSEAVREAANVFMPANLTTLDEAGFRAGFKKALTGEDVDRSQGIEIMGWGAGRMFLQEIGVLELLLKE